MITLLSGKLLELHPTRIVVGVNGVGYELVIPLSSFERLPKKGGEVTILTHLHVTEDSLTLYGFMREDERALFRMLLGVSGIGPKVAISILSGISPKKFCAAVSEGSAQVLSTVPGIGRKKAERIIVELRDRIDALESRKGAGEPSAADEIINDAALALISLGYNQAQAKKAVGGAVSRLGRAEDVEKLIREALKAV